MSILNQISQIFTKSQEIVRLNHNQPPTFILVGLGNPGAKYMNTRHNIGRLVVEKLATDSQISLNFEKKFQAQVGTINIAGRSVVLLLPETFMNNSGNSVRSYINFFKNSFKIVVVHDDLDLPLGKIKLSTDTTTGGGHNGVKSVLNNFTGDQISRLRLGIAPTDLADDNLKKMRQYQTSLFVTGTFTEQEREIVARSIEEAVSMLKQIITADK